jgi:hypothetical protein
MKQLPWVWFDHRTDLPQWLTSRIGQIVAEWSVLERELEELIQMLMNTDIGFSRVMTNRMSARNRIDAALSLIEWYVYHGRIKASYLKEFEKLRSRITNATQSKRDMVAHGLWGFKAKNWWVLRLRGQRSTPELRPKLGKLTRALLPQRELITIRQLDQIVRDIIFDARAVHAFCKRVHRVRPKEQFQYAPPKYTRRRRRKRLRPAH